MGRRNLQGETLKDLSWGSLLVECLPSKHKALCPTPSSEENKKVPESRLAAYALLIELTFRYLS